MAERKRAKLSEQTSDRMYEMIVEEARYAPGSKLPKVQAAVEFARSAPGRTALITLLEKAKDGVQGKTGTLIRQ